MLSLENPKFGAEPSRLDPIHTHHSYISYCSHREISMSTTFRGKTRSRRATQTHIAGTEERKKLPMHLYSVPSIIHVVPRPTRGNFAFPKPMQNHSSKLRTVHDTIQRAATAAAHFPCENPFLCTKPVRFLHICWPISSAFPPFPKST